VHRISKKQGKKIARLNLHHRIEIFEKTRPEVSERLKAIKWLGNVGSHAGGKELTHDDLLDAFEILETVLIDLYSPVRAAIERKAKLINSRKGPARQRAKATF
jgi:hypothetical protein